MTSANEQKMETAVNASSARPYKRQIRNILIHKPLQREYLFVVIALLMVSTLAIGFVIHSTIREAAFGGGFQFGKINPYVALNEVTYDLLLRVSLILFATLIVLGIFGMSFLHRVAGPVYRFRQVLMKLNRGASPGMIRLREGDYFTETAETINELIQKVEFEREQRKTMKEQLDMILATRPAENVVKSIQEIQKTLQQKPPETNADPQ